jgi:hypothetical protein
MDSVLQRCDNPETPTLPMEKVSERFLIDITRGCLRLKNDWSEIQEKRDHTSISPRNSEVRVLTTFFSVYGNECA